MKVLVKWDPQNEKSRNLARVLKEKETNKQENQIDGIVTSS